jgi:hypothetical protein
MNRVKNQFFDACGAACLQNSLTLTRLNRSALDAAAAGDCQESLRLWKAAMVVIKKELPAPK